MSTVCPTSTLVDQRTTVTYACRDSDRRTLWIEMEYPTDVEPPTALMDALKAEGWESSLDDTRFSQLPPMEAVEYGPDGRVTYLGYRVQSVMFTREGQGLFGTWTAEEKRAFKRRTDAIFRRFGFTRIPTWTKTLSDML